MMMMMMDDVMLLGYKRNSIGISVVWWNRGALKPTNP
jgi:hypothetical protein